MKASGNSQFQRAGLAVDQEVLFFDSKAE